MIERRDRPRLAREALAEGGVGGKRGRKHFDGDGALEPCVARFVHLAHSAGADLRDDLVRTQASAFDQAHRRGSL